MATKMKYGVMSDGVCPLVFAVAPFSMKVLTATLLFDAHYVLQHSKYSEDKGKCLRDFFIVIPSHFTVFVVRGILCLSLSFPCFQDSISKVSHFY